MENRFYYLQWGAALMVFIGISVYSRYEDSISGLLIFVGIFLTILFGFKHKKTNGR